MAKKIYCPKCGMTLTDRCIEVKICINCYEDLKFNEPLNEKPIKEKKNGK